MQLHKHLPTVLRFEKNNGSLLGTKQSPPCFATMLRQNTGSTHLSPTMVMNLPSKNTKNNRTGIYYKSTKQTPSTFNKIKT